MIKYDAILIDDQILNESDSRTTPSKIVFGADRGPNKYVSSDNPRLYSTNNYGYQLQQQLNGMTNYWAEVSDFGKWVVAMVGHHNHATGTSATKTFLIVFGNKDVGTILSSSTKWRSISGVGQAASYIRSVCSALDSSTANKL